MALIKSLTVEKFRGVLDSTLQLDGKSLILHGENGCGKSSFVDAVEFFFKGEVGHLQGAEGVSLDRHGPHALHNKDASKVSVEFVMPNETVERTFTGFLNAPVSLTDHLGLGADSSFILRRRNLLGFIAAQAASRYDQLAELIGITDLDAVELNLKRQMDDVDTAVQTAKSRVRVALSNLSNALGQPATTDDAILSALNAKLAELGQASLSTLDEIEARKATIVAGAKSPTAVARTATLQAVKTKTENLGKDLTSLTRHAPFWVELTAFQADVTAMREQAYQTVLARAAGLLETQRPDACPVCERPFDASLTLDALVARIRTRLDAMDAATKRAAKLQSAESALKVDVDSLLRALQTCRDHLQAEVPDVDLSPLISVESSLLPLSQSLESEIARLKLRTLTDYLPPEQCTACAETLRKAAEQLELLFNQTAPTQQDRQAAKGVELLASVESERNDLRIAHLEVSAKTAVSEVISALYERFSETKKTEVQRIFDELQDDIRRFYGIIHPGEGHRAVSLVLPRGRRASAHIKMGFYHHDDEDPRGYNSEAHLDSLGLCIFFAFVKRFNGGFPMIILDDVVSSVDAAHRTRICRLLCEEFADVQLIVTTHDYIWMEEWEAHQRAFNATNRFVNVRILDWTLDNGPVLDKYEPRWESLQRKLTAGDREGAASETRRILEWFLLELCFNLEAPVPLTRDGKYTVNQLYDPAVARLKKLNGQIQENNVAVFQNIRVNGIFGNLLTHNNTQAGNASMAEVQSFAAAVRDLYNLFYCSGCEQLVKYDRNDRELKCKCRTKIWATS